MAPVSMSRQNIINKCNQVGKPLFLINMALFLLFGGRLMIHLMRSKVPDVAFFILILYFGYFCFWGWGFIQIGKMMANDALMNNYTPPPALALFGKSRDQIVSKFHQSGLTLAIINGVVFVFLGLGILSANMSGNIPAWSISIPIYFGFHAYLGWRMIQLSKMIKADATLFNIGGVHAAAETVSSTVSMSSMPQSASADPPHGVEPKGTVNEEE